jgi:hypothetical protein
MRLVAVLLSMGVLAGPASAAAPERLQPGMYLANTTGNGCTANFVYDGLDAAYGRVFLGTAAHCVNRVGEPISSGGEVIGTVAALGDAAATATDWAMIEIAAPLRSRVEPGILGHPQIPVGLPLRPEEARQNDAVQFSGYGQGFDQLAETRESRTGFLQAFTAEEVRLVGLVSTGDSGGPVVHLPSGRPLAILTSIQPASASGSDGTYVANVNGPTAIQILAQANGAGLPLRLRTLDSPPVPAPAQRDPAPTPSSSPSPSATPPTKGAPAKKPARGSSCRGRAKKIKRASKRRAALRRCAASKRRRP